jgi:hypothetical protein
MDAYDVQQVLICVIGQSRYENIGTRLGQREGQGQLCSIDISHLLEEAQNF